MEFSKPYLLVNQTFLVRSDSPIKSIADIDRQGRKLGATRADSIAFYLRRTLKQEPLIELDDNSRDAFIVCCATARSTHRLKPAAAHRVTKDANGVRLLPDDLYGVEQTIIVPGGRRDALDAANQFIDEVRRSGALKTSVERSGVVGIAVAPER